MSLSKKYRFYIVESSIGTIEINPSIESLGYTWDKVESVRNLKRGIDSDIVLTKSDFQAIYNLEQLGTCTKIDFLIDVYCGGVWVRDFDGVVLLRKCKFDLNKCEVTLGIESNEVEDCIQYEKKENILDGTTKVRVKGLEGVIDVFVTTSNLFANIPFDYSLTNTTGLSNPANWSVAKNKYQFIQGDWGTDLTSAEIITTFLQQKVPISPLPPNGSGWVSQGAFWVRPLSVVYDPTKSTNEFINGGNSFESVFTPYGVLPSDTDIFAIANYENGVTLFDVLTKLLSGNPCTYVIKSDLFGINADNTHPSNIAYDAALLYYQKLIIWKTADIKRSTSRQKSTIMEMSLAEMLNQLKVLFNATASVYEIAGVKYFRIEHESYWSSSIGLDATIYDAVEISKYQYDSEKLPRTEKFLFASFTDGYGGTFDGYTIQYPVNCTPSKSTNEYRAELTLTNLSYINKNDTFSDTGICIAATYQSNSSLILLGDEKSNDYMGLIKLMEYFLYYGRPFDSGIIGDDLKTFIMDKVKIENVELLGVSSCTMNSFLTQNLVKTKIGEGEIQSMKYDALNCKLSLTLRQ